MAIGKVDTIGRGRTVLVGVQAQGGAIVEAERAVLFIRHVHTPDRDAQRTT